MSFSGLALTDEADDGYDHACIGNLHPEAKDRCAGYKGIQRLCSMIIGMMQATQDRLRMDWS